MATGKSDSFILDCTSSFFESRVNWKETYDASTNKSTVTISSVEFRSSGWYGFTYYPDGVVKVNGVAVITMDSNLADYNCRADSLNSWTKIKKSGGADATGSIDIVHDADGRKSITIEVVGNRFSQCYFYTREGDGGSGWGCTGSKSIDLTTIATYTLSISAGAGSSITVSRTSSGYAGTGNISSGTRLYYGDKLKITFSPNKNYRLLTTTVNGSAFTSGNTHTVASNVSVTSTAQILASDVGATNANIGSVSTITITKYNSGYCHSLQYSFGGLIGYITSSGGVQSTETKFSETSVAFTVPTDFYAKIPNAKTGTCTITCRTYSSSSSTTVLGSATTCAFTVTATGAPLVSGTVIDMNASTVALTGNSSTLIRYRSSPRCTITATPKNSSSISNVKICGSAVSGATGSDGVVTAEKIYSDASYTSYEFFATDSRGYSTSKIVSPTIVSYMELTCSPVISRPTPTGNSIVMSASGALYRGSFGAAPNELILDYRYKTTDGSYSSWHTIPSSSISIGSTKYTLTEFSLGVDFDYKVSYVFQIRARDGGTVDGTRYTLSTVTKTIEVQKGIPIFDWGENDFAFHVPVQMDGYPISGLPSPVEDGDVVPKAYVDAKETDIKTYAESLCADKVSGASKNWLPSNGMKFSDLPNGFFAYSTNPSLLPEAGIPSGFSEYGTLWGVRSSEYDIYQYVDVLGRLAIYNTNQGNWCVYSTGDYVVSQGTSGSWTYRKWKSGLAECWCKHAVSNYSTANAWGTLYDGAAVTLPSYPFTFKAAPTVLATWMQCGSSVLLEGLFNSSTTKPGTTYLARPNAAGGLNGYISIYAVGMSA